jgi:hypothetical protein
VVKVAAEGQGVAEEAAEAQGVVKEAPEQCDGEGEVYLPVHAAELLLQHPKG